MKKQVKLLITVFSVATVLMFANSLAFANTDTTIPKIAVVDVQKIVANSNQVKNLKAEQIKKSQELEKWVKTAVEDVKKQSSDEKKQALSKKYDEELLKKREALRVNYVKKLAEIDKNISNTIEKYAKSKGYTFIITKSTVLYGGDDITSDLLKIVK